MSFPLKKVFHCHTYRCGHATGTDEEYVLAAIDSGIEELWFTDHAPIPGISQEGIRMEFSELDEYISSINKLKEKYKDKIKIKIGLECEYSPEKNDYLFNYIRNKGIEELILGQHGTIIKDKFIWSGDMSNREAKEMIDTYFDNVLLAIDSGLFKYFAHPDLILNCTGYFDDYIKQRFIELIHKAIENNVILEINAQGVKNNKCNNPTYYPCAEFWKIVKGYKNAKVYIGADAHEPQRLRGDKYIDACMNLANNIEIKVDNLK